MPNLVGPSHHVFYSAMVRRQLWLQRIVDAYAKLGDEALLAAIERTKKLFTPTLRRTEQVSSLGLSAPYPLNTVLDDTPIDAFLLRFYEELCAFESHLFELLHSYHARKPREEGDALLRDTASVCALWGKEVAGEKTITPLHQPFAAPSKQESLKGIYECLYHLLEGGDLQWKPLLPRRLTEEELQYEPRRCPHARNRNATKSSEPLDLACRLESVVFEEFCKFLAPRLKYSRVRKGSYCLDTLAMPPDYEP